MKKMVTFIVLLMLNSLLIAQFEAPEIVRIGTRYNDQFDFMEWVILNCAEITDPDFEYFKAYWDDTYLADFTYTDVFGAAYEMIGLDFTLNTTHTIGAQAVYTTGESAIFTLNFYLSGHCYDNVQNPEFVHDFNTNTTLFQWDAPETASSIDAPQPTSYDIYLNGEYLATTSELEYTYDNMVYGESYDPGIVVNYDDGYSSLLFHDMLHKEIYFSELDQPEEINIDSDTGILSWQNPGQGDIVGGTIMNALAYWPGLLAEPAHFGDGTHFVDFCFHWARYFFGFSRDEHAIILTRQGFNIPTEFATDSTATNINQLNDVSTLSYNDQWVWLWDAETSTGGFGDLGVAYDTETGYYSVFQNLELVRCLPEDAWATGFIFNATWWFDTTGTGDFSNAPRYFPLYYNIYLDGAFVDTVNYEIFTWDDDNNDPILIDSTLTPKNHFDYQFEGLVNGQEYTAGIEAVYYGSIGKAEIAEIDFAYDGISVDEPQTGTSSPVLSNYPNPFNQHTNISFSITKPGHVTLDVYNIKGEKVKTLVDETLEATDYTIEWNGTDDNDKSVSNGVYLYRMSVDDKNVISNKMILMR